MAGNETEADSGTEETLFLHTDNTSVSQWEMKQEELCVFGQGGQAAVTEINSLHNACLSPTESEHNIQPCGLAHCKSIFLANLRRTMTVPSITENERT